MRTAFVLVVGVLLRTHHVGGQQPSPSPTVDGCAFDGILSCPSTIINGATAPGYANNVGANPGAPGTLQCRHVDVLPGRKRSNCPKICPSTNPTHRREFPRRVARASNRVHHHLPHTRHPLRPCKQRAEHAHARTDANNNGNGI